VREADQLITEALRDIAAEAAAPEPMADAAWRAGRRRRLAVLGTSAASIVGAIALTLALVLPPTAAPRPVSPPARPSPFVSITLAPTAPASPEVLTTAAGLLGHRVAFLDLANVQIRVSGPDIVLTGPAADEAQLKAIAGIGVLDFRQVLLDQPYGMTTAYGDAGLVNRHTLGLFRKLTCTPGNTSTWPHQVGYTAADYDNPNTQTVSCDSSGNKYALDVATVRDTQITNAMARPSGPGNQWTVLVPLNSAGGSAFGALTSHLYQTYFTGAQARNQNDITLDTIAAVLDGNVITASEIDGPILVGIAALVGNITQAQAKDIAAQVRSGALPVGFRVSAVTTGTPLPG
jgi:preprotein translocase subunit SecD